MARELNENELSKLNGGGGGFLTKDAIDMLGLFIHNDDYCCDSFAMPPQDADTHPSRGSCYKCVYGAYIIEPDGASGNVMACLLGK